MFNKLLNQFKSNQFYRDIVTLAGGSVFGQLILLLSTPFLTRIYTPQEFGVYAIYVSVASIVSIFTTGRYEFAIAIPKKEKEGKSLLKLIFFLGIIVSFFYLICVFIYLIVFNSESPYYSYFVENLLYMLPISALFAALRSGMSYMVQRKKMYKIFSIITISQNIIIVTVNLVIGVFISIKWGLVIGLLVGQLSSILFLFSSLKYNYKIFKFNFKELRFIAKKYINFPKFMLFSDLAMTSSQQLTPIVFSFLYSNFIVGNFSMANRILRLPAIVLTSSIANVFRNDALEEIRKNGNCNKLYKYTIKRLFLIGLPTFSVVAIFAPWLFQTVFGEEWLVAGQIAQIISIMMIFDFVALPFNSLFYIYDKQNVLMYLQIANTIMSIIMLVSGEYFFQSAIASVLLFSISNGCFNYLSLFLTFNLSKKNQND